MERRQTIQRELVLSAVREMHRHVTADEVFHFIQSGYPAIGQGTVYRNLSILADEGKLRRVEIPNGPDRFDFMTERHYHVRCIRCGQVFDVDMKEPEDLGRLIHDRHGIEFLDYDILFKGICRECRQKEQKEEKTNG